MYLPIIGPRAALGAWVSGIPFDLAHCFGNFVAALALYRPLSRLMQRLTRSLGCIDKTPRFDKKLRRNLLGSAVTFWSVFQCLRIS